jgi:glycosyltransferase involved in cell wall biosynthesis
MRSTAVIPTFRRQDRLRDAIASVLRQKRPIDELIVVAADPAEREAIARMVDELGGGDRGRVVSGETCLLGGVARNLGWRQASGDVILFLDDDDYWSEDKVADHMAAHEADSADAVYSGVWYVFGDQQTLLERRARPVEQDMLAGMTIDGFCPPTTSCVSVTREALSAVGGFDEKLPSYQDWELWYRLAQTKRKFVSVPQPLTYFVQHEESRVSLNGEKRLQAAELVLDKHGRTPELNAFFARERRHMVERSLVFAARRGELDSVKSFFEALRKKTFSIFEWRPYWIAVKMTGNLSRALLLRSQR